MNLKQRVKYFLKEISFLKVYKSPFKRPKLKFYSGKIAYGTPYFYPRRWVKNVDKPGYLKAVPKKIGFDLVTLGYKTKWSNTDYRFEWSPCLSFVFFKWQFVIFMIAPEVSHYWECWLYYNRDTDKSKSTADRLAQARKEFPCTWTSVVNGQETKVDYWQLIVKSKYLKN